MRLGFGSWLGFSAESCARREHVLHDVKVRKKAQQCAHVDKQKLHTAGHNRGAAEQKRPDRLPWAAWEGPFHMQGAITRFRREAKKGWKQSKAPASRCKAAGVDPCLDNFKCFQTLPMKGWAMGPGADACVVRGAFGAPRLWMGRSERGDCLETPRPGAA